MARPEKVAEVAEISQRLSQANATLLTHYRGLSVTEIAELRRSLREANAQMRVVKNTLTRRAAADAGIDGLDEMLVGPVGLVFCEDDPVAPAKALKAFAKDHPDLVVRGGYFDGEVLDEAEAIRLADLESREDLLTRLVGLMSGALTNTARLLNAPLEQQARLMQALVDAGGAPGAPTDAPADAPADAAGDTAAEPAAPAEGESPEAAADEGAAGDAEGESPEAAADEGAAGDAEGESPEAAADDTESDTDKS